MPEFKRLPPQTGQELGFCATPVGPELPERAPNLSAAENQGEAAPVGPKHGRTQNVDL